MTIFETVLEMTAAASIAIGIVLVLRLALKGMPKVFTWALWLVVLARLYIPAFPEVRMPVQVPQTDPAAVIGQMLPQAQPAEPADPVVQEQLPVQTEMTQESSADPMEVLAIVWACGAASMAAWGIVSDVRLCRQLRTAVRREDGVYLADGIDGPFVTGLLFPKIYLPSDMSGAGERYILLHERRHIRSGDPVVKLLFFGALCIHWFNPLVWVACWLAERDMELRCDEGVFRSLEQEERMDYAAALVACAARRKRLMPLAFGEGDTKRRVKNVLTYKKPRWWALVLAAALCVTAAGCMLTDAKPEYNADLLEYPGLKWGMTFSEVQAALGFSDADILDSASGTFNPEQPTSPAYHYYSVGDLEIFGFPTAQVILRFYEYAGHEPGLGEMVVYFPDGYEGSDTTDLEALRRSLTEHYGEKAQSVVMVRWDYRSGEMQKNEYPYPGDDPCYWVSKTTVRDLMTEGELEKLHGITNASRTETDVDWILPTFEEFCQGQENYAATVNLRTYEEGDYLDWLREQGATSLVLTFDAQLVVHTLTIDRYFE